MCRKLLNVTLLCRRTSLGYLHKYLGSLVVYAKLPNGFACSMQSQCFHMNQDITRLVYDCRPTVNNIWRCASIMWSFALNQPINAVFTSICMFKCELIKAGRNAIIAGPSEWRVGWLRLVIISTRLDHQPLRPRPLH